VSRVTFTPAVIQQKMAVAGLSITDLAREAKVSTPTASAATRGRAVNITSAVAIARALFVAPPVDGMADLLSAPDKVEDHKPEAVALDAEEVTHDDDLT
jgi:Helix-turn-helix